jgi:Plants and Prokaryotes Conserved (PCC) domain
MQLREGPKASFLEAAMQAKLLHEASGQRTFTVVLATGDEVLSCLQEFVQRENIHAATFTAIGALSDAVFLSPISVRRTTPKRQSASS